MFLFDLRIFLLAVSYNIIMAGVDNYLLSGLHISALVPRWYPPSHRYPPSQVEQGWGGHTHPITEARARDSYGISILHL